MIVVVMSLLYQRQKDFPAETAAQRRTWLKALYLEAEPIAARIQSLDQTQGQFDAANQLAADSVLWSNEVNAATPPGTMPAPEVVNAVHTGCVDAARKGRWTGAQVRALFGL